MKPRAILGGIIITGALVSGGATALGATNRKIKQNKQKSEIIPHISQNFVGIKNTKPKSAYLNTLDSLTLNSQYQKVYLQSLNSIKKVVAKNDDSLKILTKSAAI